MFRFAKIITVCVMTTGLASTSYAQGSRNKAVMPEVGAFDNLSSGNKKIAEALFNGQVITDEGKAPLSLDQIAASKRRSGWGRIFKNLKRSGLIDARNLRELTSGRYEREVVRKSSGAVNPVRATVVTTGSGRQIIVDKNALSRQGRRNSGRDKRRRGSNHTDKVLDSGSTYRGRFNSPQTGGASSLGITSAKGVANQDILMK